MLHPSTKKLIDRLVEMTALGKIDWQEGDDDTVRYTTEGYSVTLEADPNELVITANDGRELERATVDELAEATDADGTPYTGRVAEMTREAMRKAKGIDTAITTLLAGIDLDGDGIPDIPVDAENELPVAEENDLVALEDGGDETAAVTIDEVEAIEAETEIDMEAEATVEPEAVQSPEEDMTEAVARLADEVNGREHETADVSLDVDESVETDTGVPEASAEIADSEDVSAVETDASEGVTTEPREDNREGAVFAGIAAASAGLATAAALEKNHNAEEAPDSTEASSEDLEDATTQQVTGEHSESSDVETIDVDQTLSGFAISSAETFVESTEDIETGTQSVETLSADDTEALGSVQEETPVPDADEAVSTAVESQPEAPLTEQAEAISEVVENPAAPFESGITLSGISAGFGLGALQATGEASGVPSAELSEISTTPPEEDRVVIDATDEVVMTDATVPDEEANDLPDVTEIQASEQPADNSEPDEAGEETDSTDQVSMTPKTRFNPWT